MNDLRGAGQAVPFLAPFLREGQASAIVLGDR